ncbi:MAG: Fibronectin type III domain protein [Candidatus Nomurabacteria bacterium GW2011_GWC2_35_35]|nr:MAG: Fibronectin type III domain protein [Candidatus Nomurabacteria bacterium GW2011_GWC2_35_35]
MIKRLFIIIFIIFSFFVWQQNINFAHAESDGIEVELNIVEGCNSNGNCEQYETILGCPEDCAQRTTSSGSKISRPPPPIPTEDIIPPQNPLKVQVVVNVNGIILSWLNPPDEDFSYIRIMRNENHFHGDPFSGKLIYEGNKQYFFDKNVVAGTKYFYTLFSRDTTGNFSSGSAVSAITFSFIKIPIPSIPTGDFVGPLPKYMVHQYNQKVKPFSITIDTETMIYSDDYLMVTGPGGENLGQYMFSFNRDSGRYESIIPPLQNTGAYTITIFRYKDNNPEILGKGLIFVSIS